MAVSARANESKNTTITSSTDGEGILSSHIVEANTSHCVWKVMSLKVSMEEERERPRPLLFPIGLYGRKCLGDLLAFITASSSPLLL